MMTRLKDSFDAGNFTMFNEIVSTLVERAARQDEEAMKLLVYLKHQINPAYRTIICPPEELSKEIYFTPVDFEKLMWLYREQQAAKEEENSFT